MKPLSGGLVLWLWLLAACLVPKPSSALHFFLEGSEKKCFIEDLPSETPVVGHYKAEEYSDTKKEWMVNPNIKILITVDEEPSSTRLYNSKASPNGQFTFTAAESGDHTICFSSASSGLFTSTHLRLTLDLAIGDADSSSSLQSADKEHINDLGQRVRELNHRLDEIRREQLMMREREAEFEHESEKAKTKTVGWSLVQILITFAACGWQLSHLKNYFAKQKLV